MSMRMETAVEHSANAAERWRAQYRDWNREDTFADGETKGSVNDKLNSQRHTPENIASILNKGWAYPQCNCCGEYRDKVIVMAEEFSSDELRLCEVCIDKAKLIISS